MTSDFPLSSSGNYGQFSEIIRAKERELQQIQDLRNAQLELMIVERDKLLVEASKRYEQLKEDFEYNLSLIEARDNEIERLEKNLMHHEQDKQSFEQQIRSMSTRLEMVQQKELERIQKMETDKQNNKKIFEELRTVIESLQWSAEEDSKSKQFEIDKLKKEISILQRNKEDSLDLQRKDLSNTFEQIIQQREEAYQKREEEISKQIHFLDQRFEKLQNENLKLKELNREMKVTNERLSEEVGQKDEKIRHVSYQLQEEIQKRLTTEDSMKRQMNGLQLDLQKLSDVKGKEKLELESEMEKIKHEVLREKEYRQVMEKRLEENQRLALSESETLQKEVQDLQKHITTLQHDLAQVTAEKDSLMKSLSNKRIEIDSFVTRASLMSEEQRNLSHQMERLHHQIALLENALATCRQEKEDKHRQHEQYVLTLTNQFKDQIKELQEHHSHTIEKLKSDHDGVIRQLQEKQFQVEKRLANQQYEEEISKLNNRDHEAETARLKNMLRQHEDEAKYLKQTLEDKEKLLKEEKIETEALKLRMKAQDQQLLELQQEIRLMRQQQPQYKAVPNGVRSYGLHAANNYGSKENRGRNSQVDTSIADLSIDVPPSPMFSDDFNPGTLSIPASPMVSFAPQLQNYFPVSNQPALPTVTEQPGSLQSEQSFFGVAAENARSSGQLDAETRKISEENERLKAIIKEMRQDIELLRTQPLTSSSKKEDSPTPSSAKVEQVKHEVDIDKLHQLQQCLVQSNEEVLRLRNERKKLMDTSNELRTELSRVKQQSHRDTLETLEGLREENIDTIYSWMEDESEFNDDAEFATRVSQEQKASQHNSPVSRNAWENIPLSQSRIRSINKSAEHSRNFQKPNVTRRNVPIHDSDGSSSIQIKDSDIEVRGESFSRRNLSSRLPVESSSRPETFKAPLQSSSSRFRPGLGPSGVLAINNSSRATTSQAQALQRLKEVKQAKVNPSSGKVSTSEAEVIPPRKVVNYATLAKLENEQLDSTTS